MEYTVIKEAFDRVKAARAGSDSALVAFSGGKDSLVCLDMAVKVFKRVVPFVMFIVPGMKCIEQHVSVAKDRYGLDVLWYPHLLLFKCMINGIYCTVIKKLFDSFQPTLHDIYKVIMHDTGIPIVVNGSKESDSLWRRQKYFKMMTMKNVIYPLQKWRKVDVLAYLKLNGIPIPVSSGHQSTGIDLSSNSVLWLHDTYPEDYARLLRLFPFAQSIVERRRMYGEEKRD